MVIGLYQERLIFEKLCEQAARSVRSNKHAAVFKPAADSLVNVLGNGLWHASRKNKYITAFKSVGFFQELVYGFTADNGAAGVYLSFSCAVSLEKLDAYSCKALIKSDKVGGDTHFLYRFCKGCTCKACGKTPCGTFGAKHFQHI